MKLIYIPVVEEESSQAATTISLAQMVVIVQAATRRTTHARLRRETMLKIKNARPKQGQLPQQQPPPPLAFLFKKLHLLCRILRLQLLLLPQFSNCYSNSFLIQDFLLFLYSNSFNSSSCKTSSSEFLLIKTLLNLELLYSALLRLPPQLFLQA